MDVANATSATNGSSQAGKAAAVFGKDFDTFLQLLTTQLQYQDPLSPMDSTQFTQQLVSFTSVEQQIATNKNLESIISRLASQDIAGAVAYIGKEVYAVGDKAPLQNGQASWNYGLDLRAEETKITVRDGAGRVVYETNGETAPGAHTFEWDGRTNSGGTAPDGIYSLEVAATSAAGNAIGSNIFIRGIVEGVERVAGENLLAINGVLLPVDNIQSIGLPKPNDPSS